MDIDLLRDGEHFSTFDSVNFLDPYPDDGTTLDSVHSFLQHEYEWSLEGEQEINGDIALIPVCDMNLTNINEIPSNVDDFQKIMNDWHQFINVDPGTEFTIEETLINPKNHDPDPIIKKDDNDVLNTNNFDLTEYLNDIEPSPSSSSGNSSSQRKHKAGVKKIDLKAQRYIIDEEDDVDVETISECEESSPVLEARDLNSLLEQFEATQLPHLPENFIDNTPNLLEEVTENIPGHIFEEEIVKDEKVKEQEIIEVKESAIKQEPVEDDYKYGYGRRKENDKRNRKIDKRKSKDIPKDVGTKKELKEQATPVVIKQEPRSPIHKPSLKPSTPKHVTPPQTTPQSTPDSKKCPETPPKSTESTPKPETAQKQSPKETKPKISEVTTKSHEATTKKTETTPKLSETPQKSHETPAPVTPNKQILDSLPQELIARIKESGKRKPISVIPPIPTRKRGCPRSQETNAQVPKNKIIKLAGAETVQLDHDYCSVGAVEPYPKNPKKDSGFESAEEDDRTVIGKQPTVKNADGKLMVSLLKVNTIHSTNKTIQKKKLNFEEYKKRREGLIKSHNNSQDCSPISSTCSSPLPEDENTRLLRHQEKLMRMAMEVLNTPPKGEKKPETPLVITPPQPVQVPPDMVMKTLVSIGVNTDFKVRRKNLDPLAPVERLDEMKPLLQRVSDKINCNSLITSVIENIPKVIASCDPHHRETTQNKDKLEHGEDKTIVFLPKNRICKQTNSVECQTNISLIQQTKASRYRRRNISNSSSSSDSSESSRQSRSTVRRHNRNRSSNTSRCSSSSKGSRSSKSNRSSSTYSSRSSSRSRSRSSSPRYSKREKERLREVEERRVIYVGRIITGTTREDLRKRFQRFGPITNISLHSRDHTYLDNYGFVTFANKLDAYEAIEHGNDDPWHPKYDLSFGGRRIFCQTGYSDLDNVRDEIGYFAPRPPADDSFDKLLREVQEKMRKRKA